MKPDASDIDYCLCWVKANRKIIDVPIEKAGEEKKVTQFAASRRRQASMASMASMRWRLLFYLAKALPARLALASMRCREC